MVLTTISHFNTDVYRLWLEGAGAGAGAGRGLEARSVAMVLVREKTAWSYREIGEHLGGVDYAAVAQRITCVYARERSRHAGPAALALLRKQCQRV